MGTGNQGQRLKWRRFIIFVALPRILARKVSETQHERQGEEDSGGQRRRVTALDGARDAPVNSETRREITESFIERLTQPRGEKTGRGKT